MSSKSIDSMPCPKCARLWKDCPCSAALEEDKEQVNHPQHYGGDTTYEAIKVIEAWGLGFHLGNTVKYVARAGRKQYELEDLEKAKWYLDRRIEQLKESQ